MSVLSASFLDWLNFASRNGLAEPAAAPRVHALAGAKKLAARRTGMKGETLRVLVFAPGGLRAGGEKLHRAADEGRDRPGGMGWGGAGVCGSENANPVGDLASGRPGGAEDAVNLEKRRNLSRIARRFLQQRRIGDVPWRFDVLAIDSARGSRSGSAAAQGSIRRVG